MKNRCQWCEDTFPEYVRYHDEEWGVPVTDDKAQFEFLVLESAQAGLSWGTILKKREGYRKAFANFDVEEVARFDEQRIQQLKQNPEIIRNEQKIRAAVNNAQKVIELQEHYGSFSNYIWSFVDGKPVNNRWTKLQQVPATSEESDHLAADLKKRGFKFIGSTIIYAHMQATGMVNDHTTSCFRHNEVEKMHQNFTL
ncbi:DNA-3-methyladenine glycosylase I [Aliifodinibius sp. S!AR15-10]|uniref:DNA-3-methyladenine glycosylase I n=1 Tax=Aliifodinibius sp. S!AR15-10 TaxID=2950437 RepID=UPI002854A4F6|nr:DNA-3-methyladenine glycosylase I [Aliifodinibius sp. S!AR15-10]MDR8391669.1 DNA-3-methyladenine glycosylase I [Aliifodinibius sp. S!AR15-10]